MGIRKLIAARIEHHRGDNDEKLLDLVGGLMIGKPSDPIVAGTLASCEEHQLPHMIFRTPTERSSMFNALRSVFLRLIWYPLGCFPRRHSGLGPAGRRVGRHRPDPTHVPMFSLSERTLACIQTWPRGNRGVRGKRWAPRPREVRRGVSPHCGRAWCSAPIQRGGISSVLLGGWWCIKRTAWGLRLVLGRRYVSLIFLLLMLILCSSQTRSAGSDELDH